MTLVVTLIAASKGGLDEKLVGHVATALGQAGSATTWLAPGEAADITIESNDLSRVRRTAEATISDLAVDAAVQPPEGRRKRLLVADMDSTIIGQECIDELADAIGLRDTVSAITERAMRGELDFEEALRERAAMLKGLGVQAMTEVLEHRITLTPGARTLVATMRSHGALTALVSGGFTFFTSRVRELAGFDIDQANELVFDGDGNLAGTVREPILGRQAKLDALNALASKQGLRPSETLAVGDGANDLAMIEAAGTGIAFHAKPAVAAKADICIRHADLRALLYVQGYTRSDFIGLKD